MLKRSGDHIPPELLLSFQIEIPSVQRLCNACNVMQLAIISFQASDHHTSIGDDIIQPFVAGMSGIYESVLKGMSAYWRPLSPTPIIITTLRSAQNRSFIGLPKAQRDS